MQELSERQRLDRALIKPHEDDIYNFLLGSVNSPEQVLQQFGLQDVELDTLMEVIEELELFECATCGWWCEFSDQSENEDEMTCNACESNP